MSELSTLGQSLLDASVITSEVLEQALQQRKSTGESLDRCLVKMGVVSEEDLLHFLEQHHRVPAVDLRQATPDEELVRLIPVGVARKFNVVPVKREGRVLTLAMVDPSNIFAVDDLKFITGLEVQPVVTTESLLRQAIDQYYETGESLASIVRNMEDEGENLEIVEANEDEEEGQAEGAGDAPVVKFVNSLISDAVRKGVSDIHLEPYEKSFRVRFRLDGALYETMSIPLRMRNAVISRIKIMAELDIAERRVPQDGRIKIKMKNKTVDLRVSTLPTLFGEKVVMRILDQSNLNIDLHTFGFGEQALKAFLAAIESPWGMVLVTGPTGSGKTTTLYSALSTINRPEVNIMTAEDPAEYNLMGINQVNVNEGVGLTFAAALRAFLRQDPNIVMVGEVRDGETGAIATKAALTGHLVLSTIHTNDAPSTIDRLVDMGIAPFLVAASLNLVLAQRLVRRICVHCREPITLHPEVIRELGTTPAELAGATIYRGAGCDHCNHTGYRGRTGVFEVMPITPALRRMILDRASTADIRKQAVSEGMVELRGDALEKLKQGVTSAEEVLRETMHV